LYEDAYVYDSDGKNIGKVSRVLDSDYLLVKKRGLLTEGRFEVRRFRPNIVVESASKEKKNDFIENSWVVIGKDIVLNITAPCTRCVMITLPQGDLPQNLGILSTVARHNQVHAGVYASVERGGEYYLLL
jgi:uncharacterized protein